MITQEPSLDRLTSFEKASWPEHEQASTSDLQQRLNAFPEGVFILSDNGTDVAQVTLSPKNIVLEDITSFERMRDLPVNRESTSAWVTNLAARTGEEFRGKGYARTLLTEVVRWANRNGINMIAAGVTCAGYAKLLKSGEVTSIEDYLAQNRNPALKTFQSAAKANGCQCWHSTALANYWEIDEDSHGYGVLVVIDLRKENV